MTKIGHNEPPKTLDDFLIKDQNEKSTGRIKLTNTIIKKYLIKNMMQLTISICRKLQMIVKKLD